MSVSKDMEAYDDPYSHELSAWEKAETEDNGNGIWQNIVDSFKRDPHRTATPVGVIRGDGKVFNPTAAARNTANTPLLRKLKGRHLQMIAIGGSIGTGLFVGSGVSLSQGGPASLLIAYCLIGMMLYCTVHALGEMAVLFPVAGSFSAFSTRFLDPAWGFAMGWNYALQWLVVLPLELTSATLVIDYWNTTTNNDAFVIVFLAIVIAINFFGVVGYGEAEFVLSFVKVIAVIGFILLGIVLNIGGGPGGSYIGGKLWGNPGAFNNGFKGLCSVFVNAAFAFAGTELVGLAAAETANPRKTLPTAIKQVFWRITIFYVISLTLVGLLVPYNDPKLLSGATSADTKASPFVIAIDNAKIAVLPSCMNAVIMVAVISVANSAMYGSTRTLAALAEQGMAPAILAYIDRRGRPLVSIGIAASLGFLAFFAGSKYQGAAFLWMIAISGLSSIFTWASICLAHIRFRKAWHLAGRSLDDIAFKSQPGLVGSWLGLIMNVVVLVAQFWTGFAPIGYETMSASDRTKNWFSAYLAAPMVIAFYIPYKIIYKTKIVRASEMDIDTGMRELNVSRLIKEEKEERMAWPKWKRAYKFFC